MNILKVPVESERSIGISATRDPSDVTWPRCDPSSPDTIQTMGFEKTANVGFEEGTWVLVGTRVRLEWLRVMVQQC